MQQDHVDADDLRAARVKTAMASPEHLKQWLKASGRAWVVFKGDDLVNALPWPGGVQEAMNLFQAIERYRSGLPADRMEVVHDPVTHEQVEVPAYKTAELELEELDRVIRFLAAKIYALKSDWKLEDPAL